MLHELTRFVPLLSLAAIVALATLVRLRPFVGWLVLAGLVIAVGDWADPAALIRFGDLTIYPQDIAGIVFLLAVVTTSGSFRHAQPADLALWGVVAALVVVSVLRGVSAFGLATTGNEVRALFQLAAATLWVWCRVPRPEFPRDLDRWCWITGFGLTIVAFVHMSQRGLGSVDELVLVNGELVTTRPLVATQALVLGLIGLGLLTRTHRMSGRLLALGFVLLAVVCQQRSVWAALIAALVSLVLLAPALRGRIFALAFVSAFVLLVLYAAGTLDPLLTRFDLAFHSRGTLIDRELAWRTLVSQQNEMGGTTILTGQPFGAGFARRIPGGGIEIFAPHNYYVSLYLRIGLIGAVAFVLAMLRGLWRNVKFRQPIGVAWGAGLLTYSYAYNLQLYVAPILALALGAKLAVSAQEKDADAVPQPEPTAAR